jgi:glycosyltransferase involved in cell wall biosynthesis
MVANWDWVLYNFRLALAKSLRREGYRVTFVCPDGEYVEELRKEGFSWIEWSLKRRSLNPLMEVRALWSLARIYQRVQPDLLHHDTIKPNVYGALATWLNEKRGVTDSPPEVINSFMGIGFLFSNRPLARYLRPLVLPLMRFGMRQTHIYTTFSNHEDRETFIQQRLVRPDQTRVIVSEFVNTDYFHPPGDTSVQEKQPVRVLMAARLLWDKGVQEFVEAAQLFDQRGVPVEFLLAGEPDTSTPGFVPEERLREWHEAGTIRWLGHRSDMPNLLRS